jgi:phenylalanyl-tRNA synthetase beta chain
LRFGRGADPAFATVARDLLARRLEAWAGARLVSAWAAGEVPPAAATLTLTWAQLDRVAGYPVDHAEAAAFLRRLGCSVAERGNGLAVRPPSWRHDQGLTDDLAEEVLRLKGYDVIPSALPPLDADPAPLAAAYLHRRKLASRLAHLGFLQTMTLGFGDPHEARDGHDRGDEAERRTLRNPLGEDYSVMRSTLLRDLGRVARMNLERGAKEVRLFEIAPVYEARPGEPLSETWTLGLCWAGEMGGEDPLVPARALGQPEGRSFLIGVLRALGVGEEAIRGFQRWKLADGEGTAKEPLGWQFELPLSAIPMEAERVIPAFTPFSRFPVVERDISLLVDLAQGYGPLRDAVAAAVAEAGAPLQDLRCVDVFRHKSLPKGRQAWLLRLRFQAMERTLTGEEVDRWMERALAAAQSLGCELRG